MEWPASTIQRLRDLWDEGHSTAEIGRILGVSKNAVVGKARRLDLAARPSPIVRGGAPRPRRVQGPTLPALPSAAVAPAVSPPPAKPLAIPPSARVRHPSGGQTISAPPPAPSARVAPSALPGTVIHPTCAWPLWSSSERPTHQYCDAPTTDGEPGCPEDGRWCAKHRKRGYVQRQVSPQRQAWMDSAA